MKSTGHVARMGENRIAYNILAGNPERKKPRVKPTRTWVKNIEMDLN
jgi:hypothetical protein